MMPSSRRHHQHEAKFAAAEEEEPLGNNNDDILSEDGDDIIWDDNAGIDLRHLFAKNTNQILPPTMTQQVDELLMDGDSDDSRSETSVNRALTPPPPASAHKKSLLDSGDVPATISKLKRRRRQFSSAADKEREKLSAKQEFNSEYGVGRHQSSMLPLRKSWNNNNDDLVTETSKDFLHDDDGVDSLLMEIEQGLKQKDAATASSSIATAAAVSSQHELATMITSNDSHNIYNFDGDNEDATDEYMLGLSGDGTTSSLPTVHRPWPTTSSPNNHQLTSQVDNGSYDFLDNNDDDAQFASVDLSGKQCPAGYTPLSTLDNENQQRLEKLATPHSDQVAPPLDAPIRNRRHDYSTDTTHSGLNAPAFLSFTRYIVRNVKEEMSTYTKTIHVKLWSPKDDIGMENEAERLKKICSDNHTPTNVSIDGSIFLRGNWYHTKAQSGDILNLVSISGKFRTDPSSLPIVLNSDPPVGSDIDDDLVLVIHPDELMTPTLVSEAVKCPRLAVLQHRLGSTGLSAKSAVVGTLRHDLFESCLRQHNTSRRSASLFTRRIIRNNAEALVGCGITDRKEAFGEVMKTLPQIQSFLDTYTSWATAAKGYSSPSTKHGGALVKGMFPPYDAILSVDEVFATEEWALVPELGLKGNVDATISGRIRPVHCKEEQEALLPIELKTGHNQNPQHNHLAQLAVYTIMLRARHGSAISGGENASSKSILETPGGIERGAADGGILLYLNQKSFCARHVKPSLSDIKTLVGQRNEIVCNVLNAARPRGVALEHLEDNKTKLIVNEPPPSALPPLLPNANDCERCYKNRECMLVHRADTAFTAPNSPPRSNLPHRRLIDHFTGHLKGTDLDYFRKWDRLIDLERHASPSDIAKSWLYDSDKKETKDKNCISSVILDEAHLIATFNDNYDGDGDATIRFCRSAGSKVKQPFTNLRFEVGTYVIIRTDESQLRQSGSAGHARRQNILIFRGFVANVAEESIDIDLRQKDVSRLRPKNRCWTFRIDRDELSNGAGLLLQNLEPFSAEALGQTPLKTKELTRNTEYSTRRRRLTNSIIRLEPPPRFNAVSEETLFSGDFLYLDLVPGCDKASLKRDFDKLNSDQKAATLKVCGAQDFAMIQGFPGSGKTAIIVFITRLLVALGKRVLLTSYTHSAVDNLLFKLVDSGVNSSDIFPNPIVRVGREESTHARVHPLLAQNIACEAEREASNESLPSFTKPNVDYLYNVVSSARVVGVSALTAPRSPLLAGQKFDVVIVDEAGQISQPAVLGAIMAADSFVLVGDHMQLPPLVVSEVADRAGYGISLFMHLAIAFPDAVAKLTMQYRMHKDICHFSNLVAYKGELKCANEKVKNQKLVLAVERIPETNTDRQWIEHVVNPNNPVVFLDCEAEESVGPVNAVEVSIVEECAKSLTDCGVVSIGVITPFRSQLRALKESPFLDNLTSINGLEISTIDRFQGRDKAVVIISLVRSNSEGKAGRLLQDFRRLNVAFSRAKYKMIIIGSYSTLHRGSDALRPVLESCRQRGWVQKVSNDLFIRDNCNS